MGPGLSPPVKRVSMDGLGGRVIVGRAGPPPPPPPATAVGAIALSCFPAISISVLIPTVSSLYMNSFSSS